MTACAFCGRENTADSRFCMDCGKPISSSAARAAHGSGECTGCGASYLKGVDLFCSRCGHRVGQRVSVGISAPAAASGARPRLALLSDAGEVAQLFTLDLGEAIIGRGDADIRFEHDHYMSPLHARIDLREGQLWVRDLGSRNGTWIFVDRATRLCDGDLMLVGSQLLRFRRLGYPGPHPPEADSTRRMGSAVPSVDIAVIEQLRADGSVRDMFHLSPGRSIGIGRDVGDWIFPYDQTMSGRHAELKSEDTEFFLQDAGSRNGVAMATKGERALAVGQRLLVGDQVLRIESF
jgi:predicted component of type VI protein secretion system